MSPILKMSQHDEDKVLDFELEYQISLTTQQRFDMMFEKSKLIKELLLKYGHRRPVEIIKRS